jgi:hypothetical protein
MWAPLVDLVPHMYTGNFDPECLGTLTRNNANEMKWVIFSTRPRAAPTFCKPLGYCLLRHFVNSAPLV